MTSLGEDRPRAESRAASGSWPDAEARAVRAAPAEPRFATVQGLRIRYLERGSGTPLLLLHGWGSSLETFHGLGGDLARLFRVTAFDFPGHGESDLPPGTWRVDDFVESTLGLMAEYYLEIFWT